jgi:hypothetical protein
MKLTIEIEQETPQVPPKVSIMADGKSIWMIQVLELELNARRVLPRLMIRFPDLSKLSAGSLTQDGANIDGLRVSIAQYKKLLQIFPWIDLP